jgi:hypothetical protein
MHEFDDDRRQMPPRELPANAHKRNDEEFNLMPIVEPGNSDISENDGHLFVVFSVSDLDPFVADGGVSRTPREGVAKGSGRSQHVIKQSQFAKVDALGKMRSEKFVR